MQPEDLIAPPDFFNHWSPELTHEQYHADKSAIGSSSLALSFSSLKAFYEGHFLGKQSPPNYEMKLGTIIHMALLEPKEFARRFIVMPEFESRDLKGNLSTSKNTKYYKEQVDKWMSERLADEIVVTNEEHEQILGMIASVKSHPQGELIFKNGSVERSGYYRDPETGIKCKIRPDFMGSDLFLVTDFKTARTSEQKLFGTHAFGPARLDLRIWMYAYGISQIEKIAMPQNLFFMVCEKTWPYESAVYFLTEEQKTQAEYDYRRAMARIADAIKSGKWPQRQTKMEPLWTPKFFIDNDVAQHEKELEQNEY